LKAAGGALALIGGLPIILGSLSLVSWSSVRPISVIP
jgi:hypothetical protein